MWLWRNPQAHPGQGCKGVPGRAAVPEDKMHRLAEFSPGVEPEVGLWCKPAMLTLAPRLPRDAVTPGSSFRMGPNRTNPDIALILDAGTGEGVSGLSAHLLPGRHQETC